MRLRLPYVLGLMAVFILGCVDRPEPMSTSGVAKAEAHVVVGSDGLTAEQRNIKKRLEQDNKPGAIQHLYIISAYSGQVLIYSTVQGKITSSGKRLTPSHLVSSGDIVRLPAIDGQERNYYTDEMIGDDGTYGSSESYLYWYDVRGQYHQHYVSGGQIIHVSDQPIAVKNIVINMEIEAAPAAAVPG